MSKTTCDSDVCTWMQAQAVVSAHELGEEQHPGGEVCLEAHGRGEFPMEGW
jgi:hypothetical protein